MKSYLVGALTAALFLLPFVFSTPNVGWSEIDTEGVRIKYSFIDRELVKVSIAVPIDVEVESFEVDMPKENQNAKTDLGSDPVVPDPSDG